MAAQPIAAKRMAARSSVQSLALGSALFAAVLASVAELALPRAVIALPFARNCAALEAYVNQLGRSMTPPIQVANLGDWYEEKDNSFVACESGQVVRYFNTNTEVCRLQGDLRWPYTAVGYRVAQGTLLIRTAGCTVLPPQPLPWMVKAPSNQAPPRPRLPSLPDPQPWLLPAAAVLLLGGLAGRAVGVARRVYRATPTVDSSSPALVVLQEEVMFLLDPPDGSTVASGPPAAIAPAGTEP
jgi:hypothetical protein